MNILAGHTGEKSVSDEPLCFNNFIISVAELSSTGQKVGVQSLILNTPRWARKMTRKISQIYQKRRRRHSSSAGVGRFTDQGETRSASNQCLLAVDLARRNDRLTTWTLDMERRDYLGSGCRLEPSARCQVSVSVTSPFTTTLGSTRHATATHVTIDTKKARVGQKKKGMHRQHLSYSTVNVSQEGLEAHWSPCTGQDWPDLSLRSRGRGPMPDTGERNHRYTEEFRETRGINHGRNKSRGKGKESVVDSYTETRRHPTANFEHSSTDAISTMKPDTDERGANL
ncbi:hypothetical protein RRG08_047323 [Elysia crispata]|uniref:Uncharacterized protein n=1 Tax=Elysia crispata TaxID=231223 RepID=A0AAE1B2J2_9GAST|nr:hypothetical protein RRG08_047323 [Elysia crispata]